MIASTTHTCTPTRTHARREARRDIRSARDNEFVRLLVAGVLAACGVVVFSLAVTGCASDPLRGDLFQAGPTSYRLLVPQEPWERLRIGKNDLAWGHPSLKAIIQVNSSCRADLDVPLRALTNHLLIGFTEREIRDQRTTPLDGRESLITHLVAKLDGVPRELMLTVLKKDVCVYDFTLIAPPGPAFAEARTTYDALVTRFRTEAPR